MKRTNFFIALILILFGTTQTWAFSRITQFAEQQETLIDARVKQEKIPIRRQRSEFLYRQAYANRLQRERDALLRSGTLTTAQVELLRAQRSDLLKQLEALDKQIEEASLEAPEMIELKAIEEANNNRIETLRKNLYPERGGDLQPDATDSNNQE